MVAGLGIFTLLTGLPLLDQISSFVAVVLCGAAAVMGSAAAEHSPLAGVRRWQRQTFASLFVMLALMAALPGAQAPDPAQYAVATVAAIALVATAAALLDPVPWGPRSLYLSLDATIVVVTVALSIIALFGTGGPQATSGAVLVGALVAATYAIAVAGRSSIREQRATADGFLLVAVFFFALQCAAQLARQMGWLTFDAAASPGLAALAGLSLLRSASLGPRSVGHAAPGENPEGSRLRLVPAVFAAGALLLLSLMELAGQGSRIGFFGVITLFGLIVGRLVFTLADNRQLVYRVERSGVFEEELRDLGTRLLAAVNRRESLELVSRTAQITLGADAVLLWMVDRSTNELEAAEVLSPKRRTLLNRRVSLEDPSSLAARVARDGEAETVSNASSANRSNGFLTVLLRAQSLLAVPIRRAQSVQGVLVCVDSHSPTAYGSRERAKAELLAAQVAVALDNAYQHDLQRRRVEELGALYRFAQSAHTALSPSDIARQLLPIVKGRFRYTYATIWLRTGDGHARAVAGDSPGGVHLAGSRPSEAVTHAMAQAQPVRAGVDWARDADRLVPERAGVRSQLAVPMVIKRKVVGVVELESRQPNAYSLNEERLLVALANHAALVIDNLQLLEEAREAVVFRELDAMKTDLLRVVSHELRTPLTAIKGFVTTLLTSEKKLRAAERREFLEIIDSESDRLRELIENLLELSRLEAGVLRIDRAPLNLRVTARDVTRKVQLSSPHHQIVCEWSTDDEVLADGRRMYQVMQNLLTNAIKYSPDGGRITLSGVTSQDRILVSVSDQGLGIPRAEIVRIFERFHRVGGEVSERIGGTGLGLAICQGLVEAHGGRIWAESEGEGRGSTFRFSLPLIRSRHGTTGKGNYDHHKEIHNPRR